MEELRAVIPLFHDRIGEVEPQRPEWRGPDDAGADRNARRGRIDVLQAAIAAIERGADRGTRDGAVDFAGLRKLRLAFVTPQRAGIDEQGAFEPGILRQEVERVLHFQTGAPVHRAAERIAGRVRRDVARTKPRGLEAAHQIGAHLEVVEHAHFAVRRRTSPPGRALCEAEHVAGLQMQNADEIADDFVVAAQIDRRAQIGDVAADAGEILTETDEQATGRIFVVVERVVGQAVTDHRREIGAQRQFLAHRQRGLADIADRRAGQTVGLRAGVGRIAETGIIKRPSPGRRGSVDGVRRREGIDEIRVDVVAIVER